MIASKIEASIIKFITNQASKSELEELEIWLEDDKNKELFRAYVKTNYAINFNLIKFDFDKINRKVFERMAEDNKTIKLRRVKRILTYSTAAVVFLGIVLTTFIYEPNVTNKTIVDTDDYFEIENTILPGTDKATLTLDDGFIIILNKGNKVQTNYAKSDGTKIIYTKDQKKKSTATYNYLTIPRGGQFNIELSDGTKVWLNSESKLKFPVSFIEGELREVDLLYGEAYFDVSSSLEHNGSKFRVINEAQVVEVLGTEFNIKAYKDVMHVYTTLVEGSVVVDNGISKQNLIPREQSNLNTENKNIVVSKVNVEDEISWKNGIFSFNNKSMKEVMRVISRWYDVDVIFKNKNIETIEFIGVIDKSQSINEILSILKSTTIKNYTIINKTIILE